MPTSPLFVDAVTPLNAVTLNKLLPLDAVAIASARTLASYLAAADAQPAFQLNGDGKHQWGPGGATALDTNLYRSAAAVLQTDGGFVAAGLAGANTAALQATSANGGYTGSLIEGIATFRGDVTGYNLLRLANTNGARFTVRGDGSLLFFSDTNLYRDAANILATDGVLRFKNQVVTAHVVQALVSGDTQPRFILRNEGNIYWGPGGSTTPDTNLYRSAAGVLKTDGYLIGNNGLGAIGGQASFGMGGVLGGGNTYVASTGWLSAYVAGSLYFDGTNWQNLTYGGNNGWAMIGFIGGGAGIDFYTEANTGGANRTYTPAQMLSKRLMGMDLNGHLIFYPPGTGGAADTNLYRAAAGVLRTDGAFQTLGSLQALAGFASQGSSAYGTSLPGSPVDGQIFTLVDSTTNPTYQWTFRYNASSTSAYKWEFIGGSSSYAEVQAGESPTAGGGYVAMTTAGPSFALPRAGDYIVEIGAYIVAANSQTFMSYDIGATGAVDADSCGLTPAGGTATGGAVGRSRLKTGLTAVTLTCKYKSAGGGQNVAYRFIMVRPIRVS